MGKMFSMVTLSIGADINNSIDISSPLWKKQFSPIIFF